MKNYKYRGITNVMSRRHSQADCVFNRARLDHIRHRFWNKYDVVLLFRLKRRRYRIKTLV